MEPGRVGRTFGIGMRVASGMLRDRAAQTAQTVRHEAPAHVARGIRATSGARRGAKRFGESIWGPFVHAGSVLWLEITGVFFAVFSLFFVQGAWRLHTDWRSGANHAHFVMYVAIAVLFFYFTVSSFYRARRKQKKRDASNPH